MNSVCCFFLMLFTLASALGQSTQQSQQARLPEQPEALVQSLYQQVVALHPNGLPEPADMKIFAPYLSKTLLHRIDLAHACSRDWNRQHPDPNVKPEVAWFEAGIFSGQDERTEPKASVIERTETNKDGSTRVYVKLTGGEPTEKPWVWRVAAIAVRENGRYVVDDVIYLRDSELHVESRLSGILSKGCNGPRWVGFDDRKYNKKR